MRLRPGVLLGTYEIISPLGAGGMGEVYRARDTKLDRDVAIKVLPESLARDPVALGRFEREAKAVAALSHPNILAIHDFGTHDDMPYAVTELLEGETLRGVLDAGPVSAKQAVDYALQIARGLSAAHERGVIHRDLKPENLFVTKGGHLKILDFGLAKRVETVSAEEETSAPTAAHTEPGVVMGTMAYMSPEQVRGLPVDSRSDIFTFGAILYELLSGKKAFKRDTPSDTMAAIMRDEPPELASSGRNVTPALDHVVRHCLEKDRENRFQSAKDIAFALSEAITSTATFGVPSVPPPTGGRKKARVAAAVLAFLALAITGVLVVARSRKSVPASEGAKRIAVLPFENLGAAEDDYFADGIADEIRTKLTSLPGVEVIARASSTPYRRTSKTPQQIALELDAKYLLTATVRWQKEPSASRVHVTPELVEVRASGAPASKWREPFDGAVTDVFQVQSDIASRVAEALGVALGAHEKERLAERPTKNLAAYDVFLKGEKALVASDAPSRRKALELYEQAVALDPGFGLAWARVSTVSAYLYANSSPTPELSARALQAAEKAVALNPTRPDGLLALGGYQHLVLNDDRRALDEYTKAQRLSPDRMGFLAIALSEQALGLWGPAVDHLRQAERLDPRSIAIKRNLGQALLRSRRYAEAREVLDRGLALAPGELGLIQEKAMTYLSEGDLSGAKAVAAAAPRGEAETALVAYFAKFWDLGWVLDDARAELLLRLTPTAFDDDRLGWALSLTQAYALKGDAQNAHKFAELAREAGEAQLRTAPEDPDVHAQLGLALAYLGRKGDAIREGERAVAIQPMEKNPLFGPYVQHQLVRIYILAGEEEKALDRLEPLLKVPYYLSPGRLRIDPNFDPLRKNPRFRRLVSAG